MRPRNVLLVPVHLDALCLPVADNKREALADRNKMPFTYKKADGTYGHSDRANISEHILSQAGAAGSRAPVPVAHRQPG